jgi:CubicO group peptidase (beta-lactamase class C family)
MTALDLCADWPVATVAAAVVAHRPGEPGQVVATHGDTAARFRLASLTKPMSAWATLIASEEGIVDIDAPVDESVAGQQGCTLRHLLSHAGGYPFAGTTPISRPERTRTYSNGGIELAAEVVESASDMKFADYLRLAVFEPLEMTSSELHGSPAHGVSSNVDDVVRFLSEIQSPRLVTPATAADAIHVQFPSLGGIVPGVGRYAQCPWGLGLEIRGDKSPHWTGAHNSPSTYGHFGGAGTMMWTDPAVRLSLIALTDRQFDEWSDIALSKWPQLSDSVIDEFGHPSPVAVG